MNNESEGYNLSSTLNNFDIAYNDVGEGNVPIIFLHGFPFSKNMWKDQLEFFKSGYRLIACDIRGFGNSSDEKSPLSIDLFAGDLVAFMDILSIQKAVVCGLSMGGYIALNAQRRFPDRFEALVLCDTQCIADTPEVKEKRLMTIGEIEVNGVKKFNEGFIKAVFHPDSLASKPELVDQLRTVVFDNSEHIIMQGLAALSERTETCSTLNEITIPTLIICGRDDEVTPLAQSESMNKQIDGSTLRVISGAGHVCNLEQPNEFNHYLGEFLNSLKTIKIINDTWNEWCIN